MIAGVEEGLLRHAGGLARGGARAPKLLAKPIAGETRSGTEIRRQPTPAVPGKFAQTRV